MRPTVGRDAKVKDLELTAEDRDNLAAVMLIPDSAWLDIHRWAVKSGTVPEFQCGIAHTLIGYAAGGWAKVPSRKQARYAVEILEMARGHVPSYDRFLRGSDE